MTPWRLAVCTFLVFVVAGVATGPPSIIGDEINYYATLYGWANYGSPTMTPPVITAVRDAFPGRQTVMRAVGDTVSVTLPIQFLKQGRSAAAVMAEDVEGAKSDWRSLEQP